MPSSASLAGARRRTAAIVSAIGLAIVAMFALDLVASRRQALDETREDGDNTARLISEQLDGTVREVDYVLGDMADRVADMRGGSGRLDEAALSALAASKRATLPQALSLAVLDLGGRTIASSPPIDRASAGEPYAMGLSGDTYFKSSTLASFGPYGAALVQARAAKDKNGALVALVAARIDLSKVQQELAGLELGDGLVVAVTDSGGRLVAMLPEMTRAVGLPLNDRELSDVLRGLAAGDARPRRMRTETGSAIYSVCVGDFPLFVAVAARKTAILSQWHRRLASYAVAAAAIISLMSVLSIYAIRNINRSDELSARLVAIESASDIIVIAGLDGKAEYVNPAYERISGSPAGEAIGSRRAVFGLSESDAEAALAAAARGERWRGEVEARRADGASIVEEATIAPVPGPSGKPVGIVAVLRDVTERRRLQERLERLAHYDSLTALPNRALFFDRLEGAVSRARREGRRFALLYLDLDGFKAINDRHGHDAGDYLLFETARRLRAAIRDSDTAARMGGDEFTVLLEKISRSEDARAVAIKIRAALGEMVALPSGSSERIGVSIGIAIYPEDGSDVESMLKAADAAMYVDKLGGV